MSALPTAEPAAATGRSGWPWTGEWAVECRDVRVAFGHVQALVGVDLRVRRGRVHGLLGPNGAGKTTLLRMLLGLVRPHGGEVRVLGQVPSTGAGGLDGVAGFVDSPRLPPYLPARRALQLLARLDGGAAGQRVDPALAAVGLTAAGGRRISRLSRGQQQRLGLAAALIRDPALLVLDEPAAGLDPAGIDELHHLVRDLAGDGRTVLLSSHDMTEVDALCDDVTILAAGRVVHDGGLAELRATSGPATSRLRTSDDAAAVRLAAGRPGVELTAAPGNGLEVRARQPELDRFVLALAGAGVVVRELVGTESALQAQFRRLTT